MDLRTIITDSARKLGYDSLKDKQVEAAEAFLGGSDTFVSLPTGYGKSVIYAVLPYVFDKLRGTEYTIKSISGGVYVLQCCACRYNTTELFVRHFRDFWEYCSLHQPPH